MNCNLMYKELFVKLSTELGFTIKLTDLMGIDIFIPVINKIKDDNGIVIIKLDGERYEKLYTLIVSGQNLKTDESLRLDTDDIEEGLACICVEYARKAWNWECIS